MQGKFRATSDHSMTANILAALNSLLEFVVHITTLLVLVSEFEK